MNWMGRNVVTTALDADLLSSRSFDYIDHVQHLTAAVFVLVVKSLLLMKIALAKVLFIFNNPFQYINNKSKYK